MICYYVHVFYLCAKTICGLSRRGKNGVIRKTILVCIIEFLINLLSSATRRKFKFSKLALYRGKEYLKAFDCNIKAMQSFTRKVLYVLFYLFPTFFYNNKYKTFNWPQHLRHTLYREKSQSEFASKVFQEFQLSTPTKYQLSIIINRIFRIIIN